MESKGSQGEEGGKDLRENSMYKVETDMQKNKWGEGRTEKYNTILCIWFVEELGMQVMFIKIKKCTSVMYMTCKYN